MLNNYPNESLTLRMSIKSYNNPDIFDMCEEQRPKISLERDRSPPKMFQW